jgi:class 3 adenylate cyclase
MSDEAATGAILVVDDDRVNRTLLTRALEGAGHSVTSARDGAEALRSLEEAVPDVVLLDVVMPKLDGMQVLERMKDDASLRDVPVIMISALDDYDSVVRCIELGAEDYLPKPFDPVLLRARISAGLSKRRIQDLERARVRDVFARFLPETVVDQVMQEGNGDARLGGVRLVGTALICDLRGFTTFAERTAPDVVVEVLNEYFGQMSNAVLDNGGTLLGFTGDGILAVFGAPIPSDDHAERAVAAAREMLEDRLPRFNAWARAALAEDAMFRMGIGISSGPFMSGNVGSARRLEYTAIGDTINTAARLEELTKALGHPVLVAESTRGLLDGGAAALSYVDEMEVRGRAAPVRLWTFAARS